MNSGWRETLAERPKAKETLNGDGVVLARFSHDDWEWYEVVMFNERGQWVRRDGNHLNYVPDFWQHLTSPLPTGGETP